MLRSNNFYLNSLRSYASTYVFRSDRLVFFKPAYTMDNWSFKNTKKNGLQKKIWKSWILIPGTGLLVLCQLNLDSGFQSLVGVRIRWAVFRIPKAKIPDCTSKISGSWIPNAKISRTPRSEIPVQGSKRKYYVTDEKITLLNS